MIALVRTALAAVLLAAAAAPAQAVERILHFVSDAKVESNGDLRVTLIVPIVDWTAAASALS